MTKKQRSIVAELERDARRDALEHHLEAARALAADNIDAATIEGMMRGMYSRPELQALIAEARANGSSRPVNTTTRPC